MYHMRIVFLKRWLSLSMAHRKPDRPHLPRASQPQTAKLPRSENKTIAAMWIAKSGSATGLELDDLLRSPALMLDASLHPANLRKLKNGCHAKGVQNNNVQCSMGGSKVSPTNPTSTYTGQF